MIWMAAGWVLGQGLSQQVVPQPTGKNGYEEYVRAAEMVDGAPFREWQNRKDGRETVLARSRWVWDKYGARPLDLIRQGNAKPVTEPRLRIEMATRFPEFRAIRALGQAMTAAAYAEFADGKTSAANERLLQSLMMGQNITGVGSALAYAHGCLLARGVFDAYAARLDQLSQDDFRKIEAATGSMLNRPAFAEKMFEEGGNWVHRALALILEDPKKADGALDGALGKAISELTGEDLRRFGQAVERQIADRYNPLIRAFRGPESQWVFVHPPEGFYRAGGDIEAMAQAFVDSIGVSYRGIAIAAAQTRTQLRLLRLHALIRIYRWEHDRWPARLGDVTNDPKDPLADAPFEYRLTESSYELFSAGRPETGIVTLRSTNAPGAPVQIDP